MPSSTNLRHVAARDGVRVTRRSVARNHRVIVLSVFLACVVPLLSAFATDANALAISQQNHPAIGHVVILDPINTPPRYKRPVVSPAQGGVSVPQRKVWVVGDSVVLGAKRGFKAGFAIAGFNAEVGRQAPDVIRALRSFAATYKNRFDIVFDIGVNGTLKPIHLVKSFSALSAVSHVVIVNASVPRIWQDPNNRLIADWAAKYPNGRIADWALASDGHPEYFVQDGVHLTPKGVKAYILCIQAAFEDF